MHLGGGSAGRLRVSPPASSQDPDAVWLSCAPDKKKELRLLVAEFEYVRARKMIYAMENDAQSMEVEWNKEKELRETLLQKVPVELLKFEGGDPIDLLRAAVRREARAFNALYDRKRSGANFLFSRISAASSSDPDVVLLHFNDGYSVEEGKKEPVGGMPRFTEMCVTQRFEGRTLVTFGGDVFSPGLLATVTLGEHMIPFLNNIGVNVACVGNHDFDFGRDQFKKLKSQCNFPWLASNMFDKRVDSLYCGCTEYVCYDIGGCRVGFIGIIEPEWISTLVGKLEDLEFVEVRDGVKTADALAQRLREREGCELVVAITHMREANDYVLAQNCKGIDLILGGHDHSLMIREVDDLHCPVVKSGSDFRWLSVIEIYRNFDRIPRGQATKHIHRNLRTRVGICITQPEVTSKIPQNPTALSLLGDLLVLKARKLRQEVAFNPVAIDCRDSVGRYEESPIGSYFCDVMCHETESQFAVLNGGSIRSDCIYEPGNVTSETILSIFPFEDPVVVLDCTGADILAALENGVSKLPSLDGRFVHVSGLRYVFDEAAAPGKRIVSVECEDPHLQFDLAKHYRVAAPHSMAKGMEDCPLVKCKRLVDADCSVYPSQMLRSHLEKARIIQRFKTHRMSSTTIRALAKFQGAETLLPRLAPKAKGRIKRK